MKDPESFDIAKSEEPKPEDVEGHSWDNIAEPERQPESDEVEGHSWDNIAEPERQPESDEVEGHGGPDSIA